MKALGIALGLSILAPSFARADENWPQWRGPALNGTSGSTGLPDKWSESENIKWKAKLPSFSGSTPVIWGDKIFVASGSEKGDSEAKLQKKGPGNPPAEGAELLLLCYSKKDGAPLWRTKLGDGNVHYAKQNMSSPSPVTDGSMVWALTGTGILTGLDLDGKVVWRINLQENYVKFGLNWGYASSPLLYEGMLIIPILHGWDNTGPSYLVALEGKSGKEVWKVERPTDAQKEGPDAYTTPIPMRYADRTEIIVVGGDYFTGHDPKTGKEIWRCGGLNLKQDKFYRAVCSPAVVGEMAFACIKQGPFVGIRGGGKGLVTDTHIAWTNKFGCDVPTPVSDGKYLYVLNDQGMMSCYDPATGKAFYERQRLPGGVYDASPLLADGKIYLTNEKARTTIIATGPEFKVLSENPLDDVCTLSSIAVSGNQLFIRTSTHLYCIGK
ncbi:MAG TPA: PQQ-binding-like beta-propeller repeat protein [Planctomycetota bacterium]|nr:PQQ-binding-like beta-propeller repeat protein [Planctomycetota bacterium]